MWCTETPVFVRQLKMVRCFYLHSCLWKLCHFTLGYVMPYVRHDEIPWYSHASAMIKLVHHNWVVGWGIGPGGALNIFSGRGVRPGYLKCGACELTFASEKGGLWAENFQIWGLVSWKFPNLGLVSWKFPNLGACELKLRENWGCRAKVFKFSQKGVLWTDSCLKWDPCERQERREKGVFRAAHPHTPFLGQCPPPRGIGRGSRDKQIISY